MIIGEQTIMYHSGSGFKSIGMKSAIIHAYGRIDPNGQRHLLGDQAGNLHLLWMDYDKEKGMTDMKLELLGQVHISLLCSNCQTSIASTISYLDNGVVFIGSTYGDSQLIKLNNSKDSEDTVELLETFTNLGPIVDFAVVDLDRQGQVCVCSERSHPKGSTCYLLWSF